MKEKIIPAIKVIVDEIPIVSNVSRSVYKRYQYHHSSAPERACHLNELYITSSGDVFPCCLVWNREDLRIGNINDKGLLKKIDGYNKICSCDFAKLRCDERLKPARYDRLNIELSLQCQAICAMCCVDAPDWKGTYDLYSKLSEIIRRCNPKSILVQGGEVLVQKKSLRWLEYIRSEFPDLKIDLVTNGCVGTNIVPRIENIFDRMTVSFVGFTDQTYKVIMGVDINKTKKFCQEIVTRGNSDLYLKFLLTPLNIHESSDFVSWAIQQGCRRIVFHGSNVQGYINKNTGDDYWKKIIDRSAAQFKKTLIMNHSLLVEKDIVVSMDEECRSLLGMTEEFIQDNCLVDVFAIGEMLH